MLATFLAAASIDVDITALAMAVMFLFLYFALQPLIINPYLRAREMRREAVEGARDEAAEDQLMAEARMREYEEKMLTARRQAQEVREAIRNQGLEEEKDRIEEKRAELDETLARERAAIEADVAGARAELDAEAKTLSSAIVARILPDLG